MDSEGLKKADKNIKHAWIAGLISAVVTLTASLLGAYSSDIQLKYGFDLWSLFDVVLIGWLTYGIYRKSRFCALGLLIYFIFSKVFEFASGGQISGLLVVVLFAFIFLKGTISAFKIHNESKNNGEKVNKIKDRGAWFYFGIILVGVFIQLIYLIIFTVYFSPEAEVISGKDLQDQYLDFVWEQEIVDRSEEIQYWYSDGVLDFTEGFYLFTDKKVVVFCDEWEEPASIISYSQIIDIEFEQNSSDLEDSQITLLLTDDYDYDIHFPVASDNGGDQIFYDQLVECWSEATK